MFRHVVMFRWSEDATPEEQEAALEALYALPGQVDVVRSFSVGLDEGLGEANHDLVVVAEFDDRDAYRVYAEHPAHRSLVAGVLGPVARDRAAVQHVVEGTG